MSHPPVNRGSGQLVVDLQGPFQLDVKLITGGAPPFAVVSFWPDVGVYISEEKTADDIIAAMQKAKALLRASKKKETTP